MQSILAFLFLTFIMALALELSSKFSVNSFLTRLVEDPIKQGSQKKFI